MNPLIPWDGKRNNWGDGASVDMSAAVVESGGELVQSKSDTQGTPPREAGSVAETMSTGLGYPTGDDLPHPFAWW